MAEAAPLAKRRRFPVLWRIPAAWRLLRDPEAAAWEKALVVLAALYVVMPFDAVSDLIPVLGWLDDVGVVAVAAALVRRSLDRNG
jgi:uncharacterized membrane protein YkvA (DUF1232 family)